MSEPKMLVGPEHVVDALRQAMDEGRLGRGYLFSGPTDSTLATAESLRSALHDQHAVFIWEAAEIPPHLVLTLAEALDSMTWPSNFTVVLTTRCPEHLPPWLRGRLQHFAWPDLYEAAAK